MRSADFGLQTPLKELVIFHPDQEYLDDVAGLKTYIEDELNIRELRLSSDEAACGVKWKVDADWAVLGKKLRKDLPRLKKALPAVGTAEVKEYLSSGKITVDGIELVAGDLTTQRYVELPEQAEDASSEASEYKSDTDGDVVILLDVRLRPDFIEESYARMLINRVQKARKSAGCQATDDLDVYLEFATEDCRNTLKTVLQNKAEVIKRPLRNVPMDDAERDRQRPVMWEDSEEQEVGGARFRIVLLEAGTRSA